MLQGFLKLNLISTHWISNRTSFLSTMESLAIDQGTNMLTSIMPPLLRQLQAIQQLQMDTLALMLLTLVAPVFISCFIAKATNVPLSCCLAQNLLAAEIAHYLTRKAFGLGCYYGSNETFHAAVYTRNMASITWILWDLLVSKARIGGPWLATWTPIWKLCHVYKGTFEARVRELHARHGKHLQNRYSRSTKLIWSRRSFPHRTV